MKSINSPTHIMSDYQPFIPAVVPSSPVPPSSVPPKACDDKDVPMPPVKEKPYAGNDLVLITSTEVFRLDKEFMKKFMNRGKLFGRERFWKTNFSAKAVRTLLDHASGEEVRVFPELFRLAHELDYVDKRWLLLDGNDKEERIVFSKFLFLPKELMCDFLDDLDFEDIASLILAHSPYNC
jgi:hypothetical protein